MRNKKVQICKEGKLIGPPQAGGDLFDTAVETATDLFVHHGLPWMGGSEALDQLSTKIRPKKNCKTNRKILDGGA